MMELFKNGDVWSGVGGLALVAMAVAASLGRLRAGWAIAGVLLVLCGVGGTVVYAPHPGDALVVEPAALQVSPIDGGDVKSELVAGARVRVENRHGGYAYVRGTGGEAGWVATVKLDRYFGERGE